MKQQTINLFFVWFCFLAGFRVNPTAVLVNFHKNKRVTYKQLFGLWFEDSKNTHIFICFHSFICSCIGKWGCMYINWIFRLWRQSTVKLLDWSSWNLNCSILIEVLRVYNSNFKSYLIRWFLFSMCFRVN